MRLIKSYWWLILLMIVVILAAILLLPSDFEDKPTPVVKETGFEWVIPDSTRIPLNPEGSLILYGKDLVSHTSYFLGPKGTVARISNGMNCQNCHLSAGTKLLGNNYSAVFSTYPKFRARSGSVETVYKRINDCIERSLNGKPLDSNTKEMKAISAYIRWLGKDVPKDVKPDGAGIADLPFLSRAADPATGSKLYQQKCISCHTASGEGQFNADSTEYTYPPLWGQQSFTTAAGLFRLSRLAGYIRYNMPFVLTEINGPLTDEAAWDIAAFVVSQPRHEKKFIHDWPDISKKPFDLPFGPYADPFTEEQHKYGPFAPIKKAGK